MPTQEIDDFTEDAAPADGDLLVSVDVSDTTDSPQGTTKKVQHQNFVAKKVRETSGPTVLTLGAVADGEILRRSGTGIISGVPAGTGITQEQAEDIVGAMLLDGGVDFSYDDGAGTIANVIKCSFGDCVSDETTALTAVNVIAWERPSSCRTYATTSGAPSRHGASVTIG